MVELKVLIDDICFIIDGDRKFYQDSQQRLRKYVTDKKYPLEDRFRIWSEYCEKEHQRWIINESEFGCLGKIIDDQALFADYWCENRYRTYTWQNFWEKIQEYFTGDKWAKNEDALQYVSSLEEFQETLINTNFGSFVYDW